MAKRNIRPTTGWEELDKAKTDDTVVFSLTKRNVLNLIESYMADRDVDRETAVEMLQADLAVFEIIS